MMRGARALAATGVAAVLVAGCTSGGGGSSARTSSAPDCQPVTTARTFESNDAVTNTLQLGLAPGASQTNAVLPAAAAVRVSTKGAKAADSLWAAVGQHFGTTAARAGQQIGTGDAAYSGTITNRGTDNRVYVVYQSVQKYSGQFSSGCSGRRATGTYVTYGKIRQGVYPCGTTETSDLATLVKRYCE